MKLYFVILSFLVLGSCSRYQPAQPQTDFHTIFTCIDSVTYAHLLLNTYLTDTLCIGRENSEHTSSDSYTGKYLIGEGATLEFFCPHSSAKFGDHFGDCGIEFKTRKLGVLSSLFASASNANIPTSTNLTNLESATAPLPWYQTLSIDTGKFSFSVLEYQAAYLKSLGFTEQTLTQAFTPASFMAYLSKGRAYPRQFKGVSEIALTVNQAALLALQHFAFLNGCTPITNGFSKDLLTIRYTLVDSNPAFPLKQITLLLKDAQPPRSIEVSNHLRIEISGTQAKFYFGY